MNRHGRWDRWWWAAVRRFVLSFDFDRSRTGTHGWWLRVCVASVFVFWQVRSEDSNCVNRWRTAITIGKVPWRWLWNPKPAQGNVIPILWSKVFREWEVPLSVLEHPGRRPLVMARIRGGMRTGYEL